MSSSDLAPLIVVNFGPGSGCLAGPGGAEAVGLGAGFEDGRVVGDAVDDGGDEAGVGEDGSPFAERQVCPDGDGGFFVSFGDDLEEEFGAAGVDLDVAEFIDLCGCPHRLTYADFVAMPMLAWSARVLVL